MPTAELEAKEAHAYIEKRSPLDAARWVEGLYELTTKLETFPGGYPPARERRRTAKQDVRQILYGHGMNAYRVLFTIVGNEVHVIHVRRAARRGLRQL
jgi:hypothetical protein